jgi:hypothetical protein
VASGCSKLGVQHQGTRPLPSTGTLFNEFFALWDFLLGSFRYFSYHNSLFGLMILKAVDTKWKVYAGKISRLF